MNQVKRCRYGDIVYQTNDTFVGRSFDYYGEFSEGEVVLFRQLVKPGQTVLDIGANIGAHTVPLAQAAGPSGRVLAFEPQRIPYYSLCANVVLNNLTNVVCHQAAVSEAAGSLSVPDLDYRAEDNFGGLELTHDYRHRLTYTVPVLKIDDLRLDQCHLMKIDVEGMEKRVLAGATETIRRCLPILYVEDDRPDNSPELRTLLESLGYELYIHRPFLYNPQNFFNNRENIFPRIVSLNLYCHPRDGLSPVNPVEFDMERVHPPCEQLYRQVLEKEAANADALSHLAGNYLSQGRLGEAAATIQQALLLRPDSVELRNDLGVVLAQQGKLDQAVDCFRQAIQSRPGYAEACNNLGIVLSQQGKLNEAVSCYQQALQIKAEYPEAHSNLGLVLASLGKLPEAIASHQRALELKPDFTGAANNLQAALAAQERLNQNMGDFRMRCWYTLDNPAAYNELGLALKAQGRLAEAIASFQEALRLRSDFAEAYNNLGVAFKERGNSDEAVASLRHAQALNPDFVEAYNNLGTMLESAGNLDEASACYNQALRRKPDFAEAHNNLGIVLNKQGKYAEALAHYQRALTLKPDYPDAHHNLGTWLVDQGRLNEGVASYERALQLKPDYVEARLGRAQAWLQMGDLERGWPEFEWRWQRKSFPPRPFHQPLWDGGSLDGRTILLHAEQGFGDTLQFIRYAPFVKQRGGRVIVECQEVLLPLLATCSGIDRLVASGSALPDFDTHAPLASLPRIFQTTLATVPADVPYLSADPESVEHWRQELCPSPALKIGIAWQGNPDHSNDRHRSVSFVSFEPLARLDGVRLFSLQKGVGTEQLAAAAEHFSIPDLGSQFQTFQDTAAVLKNLDLVITVDSAVAHCAGALGIPVWVLVPFAADWRWLLDREDSLWYPTMRLFRQKAPGNWDDVFQRVAQEVMSLLAGGSGPAHNPEGTIGPGPTTLVSPDTLALAIRYQEAGDLPGAAQLYRQFLDENPDHAQARCRFAGACLALGQPEEAVANYQRVLSLSPDDAAVHSDLGIAFAKLGNLGEATTCFRTALSLNPRHAEAYNNLGIVLDKQDQFEEAAASYRQSLWLKADNPQAHYNLANLHRDQCRLDEAVANYQLAICQKPDYAEAHTNLAMTRLLMGDFEQGWRGFEQRWNCPDFPRRFFAQPLWDGGSLAGRTILLHAEQGLGDTLQFIRYAPLVKQQGGFVIVECPPTLLSLLATCPGIDQLIAYGSPLPAFDTHAPLMSLPLLLKTTLATIPADIPYLSVAPGPREHWRRELNAVQGFKIGIFWQGDPRQRKDRQRSIPLARFAPLARLPGVQLCSLQEGPGVDQLAQVAGRFSIIDLASGSKTFADTAAAMVNLDLVVSVCSAVAHCAGALGLPVWVLLHYAADWRWLRDREDSPWYPTMRLFRQRELGNWDDVFARVAAELSKKLGILSPVGADRELLGARAAAGR